MGGGYYCPFKVTMLVLTIQESEDNLILWGITCTNKHVSFPSLLEGLAETLCWYLLRTHTYPLPPFHKQEVKELTSLSHSLLVKRK